MSLFGIHRKPLTKFVTGKSLYIGGIIASYFIFFFKQNHFPLKRKVIIFTVKQLITKSFSDPITIGKYTKTDYNAVAV